MLWILFSIMIITLLKPGVEWLSYAGDADTLYFNLINKNIHEKGVTNKRLSLSL